VGDFKRGGAPGRSGINPGTRSNSGKGRTTIAHEFETAHDLVQGCAACGNRVGELSFKGTVITADGFAAFRVCPPCRAAVTDEMLNRIARDAEQRIALLGPARGSA
jgi:hypothetical protein